jgi:hypothetical protein
MGTVLGYVPMPPLSPRVGEGLGVGGAARLDANCWSVRAYRFFFYANDRGEPRHVHIQRDRNIAKFWLDPVIVEASGGFAAHELREIGRIIRERGKEFSEAWDEFFDLSE